MGAHPEQTKTHAIEFTDIEESCAHYGDGCFDFSYGDQRVDDFHESIRFRLPSPVGTYATSNNAATRFRASFLYWCVVIRDQPGVLNGVSIDRKTLALFPPGVEMEGHYLAGTEYGVYVERPIIEALLGPKQPDHVVAVQADPAHIANLAKMISSELRGDPIEGGVAAHCFANFDVKPERFITPARERLATSIRDLIDAELTSDLCLSDSCQQLGISIRTAERAFQIRFRETMSGYIKRARLDRARVLLESGLPVTEAALDVGWMHLGRFSVEFKKRFGESPSVLQKRHRAAA